MGDLLRTTLESCNRRCYDADTKTVGDIVEEMELRALDIIAKGTGKGKSGNCPFCSAYEVHLYYQFCIKVFTVWSDHELNEDKDLDAAFYSQIHSLCIILGFLDTTAVFLPEEMGDNIQKLRREGLFPNWITGEMLKGEEAARGCLAIGKEWNLEDTEAYQNAFAKLEYFSKTRLFWGGNTVCVSKCGKGHPLAPFTNTPGSENSCDGCGRCGICPPEQVFRCELCDFDLCRTCNAQREEECKNAQGEEEYENEESGQ